MIALIFAILSPVIGIMIVDYITDYALSSKFSNFKRLESIKRSEYGETQFAEVNHSIGFVFKKTQRRTIFNEYGSWKFLDSGKLTSSFKVEELDTAEKAQTLLKSKP